MVTAGTGAGKSLAFYLPALSWIGETIADSASHGVRCLAVYPRNELLKDQLAALLAQARTLQEARATARPIVMGTWFGATPYSARQVTSGEAEGWTEWRAGNRVLGWRCPFLDCPSCGSPMIWPARRGPRRPGGTNLHLGRLHGGLQPGDPQHHPGTGYHAGRRTSS